MQDVLFTFIEKYMPLSTAEKTAILDLDIFRSVAKGTVLLKEGQYSQNGFFVLQGCIRTYYLIDGEEKTTAFYTELEGVTPNCVLTKKPSEYYIACSEDTILLITNPDLEQEMFAKFPRFERLCRMLSEELIAKQQFDFDAFKTSSPEQRYINLLKNRPDLIQRVPQYQLASYLGITPQSLSRIRTRMTKNSKQ
ncbi:MAG: Crp/Fnr family transcriptional regulator [Bacteroidota bacterium]